MKKLSKILIPTSILFIIIMILNIKFGVEHQLVFINIIFYIINIILIIANIVCLFKQDLKEIFKLIHFLMAIVAITLSIIILFWFIVYHTGPIYTVDEYVLENKKERLIVLYVDEGGGGPSDLIYKRNFILGIQCKKYIKVETIEKGELVFDLEKEYNELKAIKNAGFCKNNLRQK